MSVENGQKIAYAYICYPDGSEDEIKVQMYENNTFRNTILINKLWINGELALDKGVMSPSGAFGGDLFVVNTAVNIAKHEQVRKTN
jgi:hypothetical protein